MYQHGNVDIRVLKDILGHQNLGTTEIYTHLSNQQMEDAADANPLSKVEMSSSKHKKSEWISSRKTVDLKIRRYHQN